MRDDLRAALHVYPQGELASVQWRLLYARDAAVVVQPDDRLLVGGIREEVALEDRLCAFHLFRCQEVRFCLTDAAVLLGECFAARLNVQHGVPFFGFRLRRQSRSCRFPLRDKGRQFDAYTEFFYVYFL